MDSKKHVILINQVKKSKLFVSVYVYNVQDNEVK